MDMIAIGASGMRAQQQVLETLSSNIANVNTPSYKRAEPRLHATGFAHVFDGPDDVSPVVVPAGVSFDASTRLMTSGPLRKTGRELDVVIRGNGFFVLAAPDGEQLFTRNGDFRVDSEGYLVGANGLRVDTDVQIPPDATSIEIAANGAVSAKMRDGITALGMLTIAQFAAPEKLTFMPGGVYGANEQSGAAAVVEPGTENTGQLAQGFLESSNVQIVDEFVSLVVAQRAYEASAKMVQAADEMATIANGLLRA